ncbi:MAG: hypothetical protein WCA76_12135 [Candidatus Sulfotelmatobacter sp.]
MGDDDINASQKSCRVIQMTLNARERMRASGDVPGDDDFTAGATGKAGVYSKQLLQMAHQYPRDWNHGNAVFYGNFVLGRIAIQQGSVKQAGQYLLAAGATEGSPQLDSFGPNMTLAKELLEKGHSQVVLEYFALCQKFWENGRPKLDEWSSAVLGGEVPDFGPNLEY